MKNPINIVIPPGTRVLTIGFGETVEQSDDAVRAAFKDAEAQGVATISLTEHVKGVSDVKSAAPATALDILRTRGTPIEMIYSAVAAKDFEHATAMFRTSILEYIYEKIAAIGWSAGFIHSRELRTEENITGYDVLVSREDTGKIIALTPEHDSVPLNPTTFAPVCTLGTGRRIIKTVADAGIATVYAVIEEISDIIFGEISQGIDNANLPEGAAPSIRMVVDMGKFDLAAEGGGIEAEVNIPMVAYHIGSN